MRYAMLCFILACFGCASTKSEKSQEISMELRAGQWVSCWELCGKGDELLAVTDKHCVCRKGKSFPHGFDLVTIKEVVKPKEAETPSRSIFDILGMTPEE